jgi:hypothetical protein
MPKMTNHTGFQRNKNITATAIHRYDTILKISTKAPYRTSFPSGIGSAICLSFLGASYYVNF